MTDNDELRDRIRELEDEVAELREGFEETIEDYNDSDSRVDELESLVRDMWREITTCPDYRRPPCMTRSICERMRKLEIEVSE